MAESGHEFPLAVQHGVGEVVQDFGIIGVEDKGALEGGDGFLVAAFANKYIAAANEGVEVWFFGGGLLLNGGIDDLGLTVVALIKPEVGQKKFLVSSGFKVLELGRFDQTKRGMLKGFPPEKEIIFGEGEDLTVAIEKFDGILFAVPCDGNEGDNGGIVVGVGGEKNQEGKVIAQFVP